MKELDEEMKYLYHLFATCKWIIVVVFELFLSLRGNLKSV